MPHAQLWIHGPHNCVPSRAIANVQTSNPPFPFTVSPLCPAPQSGLGSLLASFLLPKKDLETRAALTATLKQLSPMSSPAPFSTPRPTRQIYTQSASALLPTTRQPTPTATATTPPPRLQPTASSPNSATPATPVGRALFRLKSNLSQAALNTAVQADGRPSSSMSANSVTSGRLSQSQRAIKSPYESAQRESRTAAEPAPPVDAYEQLSQVESTAGSATSMGRRRRNSTVHFIPTSTADAAATAVAAADAEAAAERGTASSRTPRQAATGAPSVSATGSSTRTTPTPVHPSVAPPLVMSRSCSNDPRSSRTSPVEHTSSGRSQSLSTNIVMTPGLGLPGGIPRHVLLPSPPQAEDSGFTSEVSSRAASSIVGHGHGAV